MATRTTLSPADVDENDAHGLKRKAEDALASEMRLAKRFNLMNLEPNSNLYIPVAAESSFEPSKTYSQDAEWMELEDTKDKVYIYDLDKELEEPEPSGERVVFIPEIERQLNRIPLNLLRSQKIEDNANNQLVLYNPSNAFTAAGEKDSLQKVTLGSRVEAQQNGALLQSTPITQASAAAVHVENNRKMSVTDVYTSTDPNAMEIE